jgi:hypothetical protein
VKITIESTNRIVEVDGVPTRAWSGRTESGISVVCFVQRIAVDRFEDCAEFDRELTEPEPPPQLRTFAELKNFADRGRAAQAAVDAVVKDANKRR